MDSDRRIAAADEFAAESHRRAAAPQANGRFDEEIVAVDVPQRRGEALRFEQDEGVRPDSGVTALARLRPIQAG
jgi:acetyl-CoA C-acetyltransferase